jgi:hypothetical protein
VKNVTIKEPMQTTGWLEIFEKDEAIGRSKILISMFFAVNTNQIVLTNSLLKY